MTIGTFLDNSGKVAIAAAVIIVVFLGVAFGLYHCNFGGPATATANSAYLLKVADAFINGAIVGVFLAMLRAIFELPKFKSLLK